MFEDSSSSEDKSNGSNSLYRSDSKSAPSSASLRAHRLPALLHIVGVMHEALLAPPSSPLRLEPSFLGSTLCSFLLARYAPRGAGKGPDDPLSSLRAQPHVFSYPSSSSLDLSLALPDPLSGSPLDAHEGPRGVDQIVARFLARSTSAAVRLGELLLKNHFIEVFGLPSASDPSVPGLPRFSLSTAYCLTSAPPPMILYADQELVALADRMADPLNGVPTFVYVGTGVRAWACWEASDGVDWLVAYGATSGLKWGRQDALQILEALQAKKLVYAVEAQGDKGAPNSSSNSSSTNHHSKMMRTSSSATSIASLSSSISTPSSSPSSSFLSTSISISNSDQSTNIQSTNIQSSNIQSTNIQSTTIQSSQPNLNPSHLNANGPTPFEGERGGRATPTIEDDASLYSLAIRVNKNLKPLLTREQVHRLCKGMKRPASRGGLKIEDRRHFFRSYEQCFVAGEAVEWISRQLRLNTNEAVTLANWMLGHGLVLPTELSVGKSFRDAAGWYRFRHNARIRDYILFLEDPVSPDAGGGERFAGVRDFELLKAQGGVYSGAALTDGMTGMPYAGASAVVVGGYHWVYAAIVHTEAKLLLYESTIAAEPLQVIDLTSCFSQITAVELEYRLVSTEHVYCLRMRSQAQHALWRKALDSLLGVGRTENEAFQEIEQKIVANEQRVAEEIVKSEMNLHGQHAKARPSQNARSRSVSVSVSEYVQPPTAPSSLQRFLSPITSVFSSN